MLTINPDFDIYHPKITEQHNGAIRNNTIQAKNYKETFYALIEKVHKELYGVVYEQMRASTIIEGWRYGFAPTAVAQYILNDIISIQNLVYGCTGYHEMVIDHLRTTLQLNNNTWGQAYGYVPALEELKLPVGTVQGQINARLKDIASKTSRFPSLTEHCVFNRHIPNANVVHNDDEITLINTFAMQTVGAVVKLIQPVFDETHQFDAETQEETHETA